MAKKKSAHAAGVKHNAGDDRQTLEQLKKLFAKYQQADLRWCWAVGQLVERLHPQAAGRKHGSGAMQQLANDLDPGESKDLPDRLRRMRRFALDFEEKEAQQLAQRKRKDGQQLTWSYVERVLQVSDHKKQLSLIEKCLAENLTVSDLTTLVRQQGSGKTSSGGRTFTPPKSVDEALRTTITLANKFRNWCQALEPNEKAASGEFITLDQLPTPVQKKLTAARDALAALCEAAKKEQKGQKPAKGKAKPKATKTRPMRLPNSKSILRGRR